MNRTSGTYGTKTKDLAFMLSQPQKKRRKRMGLKKYLKKTLAKTFSNLGRDLNLLLQEAEQNKQGKPNDIHTKIFHN